MNPSQSNPASPSGSEGLEPGGTVDGLLQRARTGDAAALGELLDKFRAFLREQADRQLDPRLRRRLDASDLVQQTCLSVHQQMQQFSGREPGQFVAWLQQIHDRNVRNAIRDQLDAQKRAAGREESAAAELPGADATPSQHAVCAESTEQMLAGVDQLPAEEAAAIRLRYLEGCGLDEAAARMNVSKDAIVWLIQKGLRRLRTTLKE